MIPDSEGRGSIFCNGNGLTLRQVQERRWYLKGKLQLEWVPPSPLPPPPGSQIQHLSICPELLKSCYCDPKFRGGGHLLYCKVGNIKATLWKERESYNYSEQSSPPPFLDHQNRIWRFPQMLYLWSRNWGRGVDRDICSHFFVVLINNYQSINVQYLFILLLFYYVSCSFIFLIAVFSFCFW